MHVDIESKAEAASPFRPVVIPVENDAAERSETVRLAPGQSVVPEELLEPLWENDRRHVMKDLAAFLLDRHLRRLGRMRNPLELRLARLLARLEKRSAYLELGFARLSDYVIERLGISARRMQILVQTDRRLEKLPLTTEAFARGQVSSSQLRLLLRIATPETEAAWLEKAARLNVRLLELEVTSALSAAAAMGDETQQAGANGQSTDAPSLVDGHSQSAEADDRLSRARLPRPDGALLDDDEEPGRPVSFECPDVIRAQWEWAVEICRRASGSTEPLWRCAEYIAADFLSGVPDLPARLAAAADGRDDGGALDGASGPDMSSTAGSGFVHARAVDDGTDLFEEILRGYEEEYGPRGWAPSADGLDVVLPDSVGDDPDDGARELDRKLRELVRLRQGLAFQQGRLLATFSTLELHRALGFMSFGRYCRERAGLGIRRARQLIALDRRLIELPALARAYREGEVSWVKASAVARVADESSEQAWIRMARSVTFRRLREETAVVAARIGTGPPDGNWQHPAWQPGRFTQPDGVSGTGEVQVDSPWRTGKTPWSRANAGVQTCAPEAGGDAVQTCAEGATTGGVQLCAQGATAAGGGRVQTCAPARSRVRFWAPDDVAALWEHALNVCRLMEGGPGEARSAEAAACEGRPFEGQPLEDWECVARMIASFLHTWDISDDPKWRRDHRIFERDGWRCRVPGCSSRQSLQVHHVIFRSHGGGDEDDNLAVLCATHHLQGIHAGRLRCSGSCEGHLRWEFGGGRDREPIMTTVEEVILAPTEDRDQEGRDDLGGPGADGCHVFASA